MISLSIIVPVYNEEKTIGKILRQLDSLELPINKEIIIVDDGSSDGTVNQIEKYLSSIKKSSIKLISHSKNQGKGKAVRTGISKAKGAYIVIQDADLEYDPNYLKILIQPILSGERKVVYGTRLKRMPNLNEDERTPRFLLHYLGNRILSFIISALFIAWITDMETGYKIFPRREFYKLKIKSTGFDFEPEITTKLLKRGHKILEIPIKTIPRGYSEGKKLNTFSDGSKALWAIIKYRFVN